MRMIGDNNTLKLRLNCKPFFTENLHRLTVIIIVRVKQCMTKYFGESRAKNKFKLCKNTFFYSNKCVNL